MAEPYAKKVLVNAFVKLLNEKSFDSISVTEVTKEADVSRNTFYYWYRDLYDLVDDLLLYETERLAQNRKEFASWQEGFLHATAFVSENRKAVFHLYHSQNRNRLEAYLYHAILDDMTAFVRQQAKGLEVSQASIHNLAVFYSSALIGLTSIWLHDDMKEDPEAYLASMGDMLEGNIRSSLVRAQKHGTE